MAAKTTAGAWGQIYHATSQLAAGVSQAVTNLSLQMQDEYNGMLYDVAGAAFYVHRELWLELATLSKLVNAIGDKVTAGMSSNLSELYSGVQQIHDSLYGSLDAELKQLASGMGA